MIERGAVGAAVEHGRRAVAAARAGADVIRVGTLLHASYLAGDLEESRRVAEQALQRPDAPIVPDGYAGGVGLLGLIDADQGRPQSASSARAANHLQRAQRATAGFRDPGRLPAIAPGVEPKLSPPPEPAPRIAT